MRLNRTKNTILYAERIKNCISGKIVLLGDKNFLRKSFQEIKFYFAYMKKAMVSLLLLLAAFAGYTQDASINVMSFNIRLDVTSDSLNSWPYRKDMAASQILFHEADFVGLQEALHHQLNDLKERLPGYASIGGGRNDGKESGEYCAILYNANRFEVQVSETFWLSETPALPGSKSWDAAITRIVTWGKFRDRLTGKEFFVFNTHFDHIGKEARKQSAGMILQKIHELAEDYPVILTGDFNSNEDDEPIKILTDTSNPRHVTDSKSVSQTPHYGPSGTFNAFRNAEVDDHAIDFIFIKNGVEVLKHATLSQTWRGRFSSDHFPVYVKVKIK